MSIVWIEKYRPKNLDDVVGNGSIVEVFKVFAEDESMPHIILTGSPGIGKTTLAECLLNRVFQDPARKKEHVLEMNASDERGVDVIRTKIKAFLQKKLAGTRYLVLDESDSMTSAAQQSMRRLLEVHANAKFIFICNDISKVADAIQSRCAIVRLSPLTSQDLVAIIEKISKEEQLTISGSSINLIAETSEGDARQAINFLQTLSSISKEVSDSLVRQMTHLPPINLVRKMVLSASKKESFSILQSLFAEGYTPEDIAKMVFKIGKDQNSPALLEKSAKLLLKTSESPSQIHFYSFILE